MMDVAAPSRRILFPCRPGSTDRYKPQARRVYNRREQRQITPVWSLPKF